MKKTCVIKLFLVSIVLIMGGAFFANAVPRAGADWYLIWSDEFDSGSTKEWPNSSNWWYESGYVRNNEWQYYTYGLQNAYCQDGFLHIEAHKHPAGTYPVGSSTGQDGSISSSSLVSRDLVEHQYGWLEMRAQIDTRWGSWPAFWTLGINGQWPDNGECDIMEWYQDNLHFNVAWWKTGDPEWTARWDSSTMYVPSMNEFHVWAMEWTPQQVRLYLDGALKNTWDSSQDSGDSSIEGFQQPHYIILNQAIGGNAGGDASSLVYPTNYVIDYVRWYQDATNYVDDGEADITYSGTWGTWSGNPGYNETEHYSQTTSSEATFTFTGDKVWYYGFKRSDLGFADILLDGQLVDTVDCYSSSSQYFVPLYESPELAYDSHTLTVRVAGVKNPASSGTEIIVDGFGYTYPPASIVGSVSGADQTGNWKENSYDDNETTRWCNDNVLGNAWIEYDLGASFYIDQVKLLYYKEYRTYPIKIEIDGTEVFNGDSGQMSGVYWKTTFLPTLGRHIKITMTAANSDGNNWFSIYEIKIRALREYQGDLTMNGQVDFEDFAELSSGWQTIYDIASLLDVVNDWLAGTN